MRVADVTAEIATAGTGDLFFRFLGGQISRSTIEENTASPRSRARVAGVAVEVAAAVARTVDARAQVPGVAAAVAAAAAFPRSVRFDDGSIAIGA